MKEPLQREATKLYPYDFHAHLGGTTPAEIIARLTDILVDQIDTAVSSVVDLGSFLSVYAQYFSIADKADHFDAALEGVVDWWIKQGIRIADLRITPPSPPKDDDINGWYSAVERHLYKAVRRCSDVTSMLIRPVLLISRSRFVDRDDLVASMLDIAANAGFYAVDWASVQLPLEKVVKQLALAKERGMMIFYHQGEECDIPLDKYIQDFWYLVDIVDRIGHGLVLGTINTQATRDILDAIAGNSIAIEVCPVSNVLLNSIEDMNHVHRFLDHGIDILVGTDDAGVFGTCMADDLELLENAGIPIDILADMALRHI